MSAGWKVQMRDEALFVDRATHDITRLDQPDFVSSGSWKAFRIFTVRHRYALELGSSTEQQLDKLATMPARGLLFNNGKPRYTLGDIDHGTPRIQAGPGNGIFSVLRIG